MTAEELLLELKDITPPPEPAWWLLPTGYLIVLCVIIGITVLAWFMLRHRRVNRLANLADQDLQRIRSSYKRSQDARQLGLELSKWLKQVSILAFPQRQPESLTGKPWLKFLDESLGGNNFSSGNGEVFGGAIYHQQISPDAYQLVALCEQWLITVKPHLLQRGRG
jgi:hypothetical protein